jgi:hypothetical protein
VRYARSIGAHRHCQKQRSITASRGKSNVLQCCGIGEVAVQELQKWKPDNMKLIIIGVDHKIQGSSTELKRLVVGITETESVKVIGEEAPGEVETFVQQIAEERNIPWIQIDMTDKERRDFGIDEKLDTRMEHSSPFQSSTDIISDEQWSSAFDENGQVIQKLVYFEKEDGIREHFGSTGLRKRQASAPPS